MSGLTVSVIVLNWNGGRLVERCVTAVYEQTYGPVELIIVDNGLSDGSLKRLQDLYPRAKYILNEQNLGFSRAVNQGIQSAGGEYILPLNLDVIMTNDFVEKMVSIIESGERVGSVSGKLLRFREDEGADIIDSTGHVICRNRYVLNRGTERKTPDNMIRRNLSSGPAGRLPCTRGGCSTTSLLTEKSSTRISLSCWRT